MRKAVLALVAVILILPARAVAQPAAFEFIQNKIVVPVTVNGRSARGVIDSGASLTVIDTAFAASIGVSSAKPLKAKDYYRNSLVPAGQAQRVTVSVASAEDMSIDPMLANLGELDRLGEDVDLLIGNDVLTKFVLTLDFERHEIDLAPASRFDRFPPSPPLALKRSRNNLFRLLVTLDGKQTFDAILDLGGDTALSVQASKSTLDKLTTGKKTRKVAGWTLSGMAETIVVHADTVRFADATFRNVPVSLNRKGGAMSGVIGIGLMRRFNLVLDLSRNRLWATPNAFHEDRFRRPLVGIATDRNGVVLNVDAGSPAAKAGVRTGDRIVALNDEAGNVISDTSTILSGDIVRVIMSTGEEVRLVAAEFEGWGCRPFADWQFLRWLRFLSSHPPSPNPSPSA